MDDYDDDDRCALPVGSVVLFAETNTAASRPLPREFPIGFHGSDRVDLPPPVRRRVPRQ